MSVYKVSLKNNNKKFTKNIEAKDKQEAMYLAQSLYDAYPVKVEKAFILHQVYKLNASYELNIFKELHILLSCGIDLISAMNEIANNTKDTLLKEIMLSIIVKSKLGHSVSSSLPKSYKKRRNIVIYLLEVAEKSGQMKKAINDIIEYLEEQHNGLKGIKKALSYPIFLSLFSVITMFFMSVYIFPQIENIFSSFNQEMPIYTKIILDIGKFMQKFYIHIFSIIILITFIFTILYIKFYKIKYFIHKNILKMPIFGDLLYINSIYRFIFTLHILLNSKIPVIKSIQISSKTITNLHLKSKVSKSISFIEAGNTLAFSFMKTKILKNTFIRLLFAGEKEENLDNILLNITKSLKKDYKDKLAYVSVFMEPILLVIIAIFILILALSTFLPIWSLTPNV
jgi:type II secretory pathway component PulF